MSLLIIRHGETPLNVARVLQPAHTPLSERGQQQADALALRLQDQRLVAVLSSDLPRALQTATAVAMASGLTVITSPLLQERNFGELRGQGYDSLGFDPLSFEAAPPGGESMAEFEARCDQAWAWLLDQLQLAGGPVAVVSHGLVIRHWLQAGAMSMPDGLVAPQHLPNACLTIAAATPPHAVVLLADTAHLDAGVGLDAGSLSGG